MNLFPLWTAIVWPTKSGVIMDARDHVFTTRFSPFWFMPWTRASSRSSTNGPFFSERAILAPPLLLLAAPAHDVPRRSLPLLAGLVALGGLPPWRHRMPAAGRLPLTASERMIDGIHGH